jgi:hypothetical protein
MFAKRFNPTVTFRNQARGDMRIPAFKIWELVKAETKERVPQKSNNEPAENKNRLAG